MRAAKLDWVRNEITRMRRDIRAQELEIRMRHVGISIVRVDSSAILKLLIGHFYDALPQPPTS